MIRNLRRRLVIILTILLSLILALILIAINVLNFSFNLRVNQRMLRHTVNRIGLEAFCENPYRDPRLEDTSYCTVLIEESSPKILINRLQNTSEEKILAYAGKIYPWRTSSGSIHSLVYLKYYREGRAYIVFMNNTYAWEVSQNLIFMSVVFCVLGIILLFFISVYLTRQLTQPALSAFEAQQRFISDASHELKTPLSIIMANTDLLERENGASQHIDYLRQEAGHMNTLINQMLTLTRMDTPAAAEPSTDFSLSDAWLETALPFESVAYESQLAIDINIASHIQFHGVREQLRQLLSILLNNAVSHTPAGGTVRVDACCHRKHVLLSVANTGNPIPEDQREKIFERFYRIDEARSTGSGHYGLGLSIAKTIVEKYHGRITVNCQDGWNTFQVTLPL